MIFSFSLIALCATNHYVLLRKKICILGCWFGLARSEKFVRGTISGVWAELLPTARGKEGVLGTKPPVLRNFAIFFLKNNLILGIFL